MIDFGKISKGNNADTVLNPRDIFNALPNKNTAKFQYPRDVQSQVWNKWFQNRDQSNSVIKMNTGSGKTTVGLLILKSSLNEGKGPAVYVCPDNYLVEQVKDAAAELGVDVTTDVHSPKFISGRSILVINIHKLVNGRSVFGVGDQGVIQPIGSLLIDDAHACLDTVEDQFTISIPFTSPLYRQLVELFFDSLKAECESKALEIATGDPSSFMMVPYWEWQSKNSEVNSILVNGSSSDELIFQWPLIKEYLKHCHCVVSSTGIEISPHAIPIHMIPSVTQAERKVFMTATLIDDSILASHFGLSAQDLENPIFPDSAGDVGDRMILCPQGINPEITDQEIKEYCNQLAAEHNVIVIVPSARRAEFWSDVSNLVLDKASLYKGIEQLKTTHVGLVTMINRYDGVDLPGDACRVLVVDGVPQIRRKIDEVKHNTLVSSPKISAGFVQRIEQGMGRGVRSNDDHCVVFLVGRGLMRTLYAQGAIDKFSPGTKAQLELSVEIADQLSGKGLNDLNEAINYCLSRDPEWLSASKGVLASLKYSENSSSDPTAMGLRNAYDHALSRDFTGAKDIVNELVNKATNDAEKGYLKQVLAEYINNYDPHEAQQIQKSALNNNLRVLKPIDGIQYSKLLSNGSDQADLCSSFLSGKYSNPNDLVIEVNGILEELQFEKIPWSRFEEAFKNIANYIGFQSQRPEQFYRKGPDVLWSLGNMDYLVIECKNEANSDTISKKYCNQLNGSSNWFSGQYDVSCSFTPILIHPSDAYEFAASPNNHSRIITESELNRFRDSIKEFIISVASEATYKDPNKVRERLAHHRLMGNDFVANYTRAYRVRSS